jgi:hypothetical protein
MLEGGLVKLEKLMELDSGGVIRTEMLIRGFCQRPQESSDQWQLPMPEQSVYSGVCQWDASQML